jgi:membrane protein required for colicin V production
MTGFDIAVLLIVGTGAIIGFMRGFVQETLALAAWVLALFVIHNLHTPFSDALVPLVKSESGASVLAFAVLLLIPYALVKLLANRMGEVSRNSLLGPLDRLLGFGFGAAKGMLISVMAFSVLVLGYDTVWGDEGRPGWITQSRSYPFINASSMALVKKIAERRREALEADLKEQADKDAKQQAESGKPKKKKH